MTYNTESSTGVDDRDRDGHPDREAGHDSEHDPRDPVYSRDSSDTYDPSDTPAVDDDLNDDHADRHDAGDDLLDADRDSDSDADDVRDEAYHAGDSPPVAATSTTESESDTDRADDTDTELDSAARRDATDTVDDDTARDEQYDDTRTDESDTDRESEFNAAARGDDADFDAAREDGSDATRMDEVDETDTDYDYDASSGQGRVDGERIAVPDGPIESDPPTAVAVAPVNAAVPTQTGRDEADAREAETDRDAVEAVNADAADGTVYQTEHDEQRADNGPIVAEADTHDETAQDDMKPGAVEPAPVAAFWNESDAEGIRDRWRELQLRFIDDPQSVTGEAELLVEEAVASLSAALAKARQDLGNWRDGQGSDTERLRAAVRSYRDFLDRILGL